MRATSTAATFGVVGAGGWRAEFFIRLAAMLPEHLTFVGAVVRRAETADLVTAKWGVPSYLSVSDLLVHQRPDFVISSVAWDANPAIVTELVDGGTKVLSETPPAPDGAALHRLWDEVGSRMAVQVAEQYLLMPGHAARRQLVEDGVIGEPTSAQVSSTHSYHAVSLIRGLLGVRSHGPATVTATKFAAPLVDPRNRSGWTDADAAVPADTVLATIDFGDGRSGLYDFTDNQWHNQLRSRRVVVRGSQGEIVDDNVVRLAAPRTIIRSSIVRSQLGHDLDLDGYDTEHLSFDGRVIYRNPFVGLRLMDEEIAIASLLLAMAAWSRNDGPPPYPLAQASQDHLIGLAIEEATRTRRPVRTETGPWSDHSSG